MGFGFGLFFWFIFLPTCLILLIFWILSKNPAFGRLLQWAWVSILGLIALSSVIRYFSSKMEVNRADICGSYIIDRSKFPGRQADWQYNHFRFDITKDEKLIFYRINGSSILETDTVRLEFLDQYFNTRIRVLWEPDLHHIIADSPTLYRKTWYFYYVFKSHKFGNVFFKKGQWKPIH